MDWITVVIAIGSAVAGAFICVLIPICIGEKWLRPELYILRQSVVRGVGLTHYRLMVTNVGRKASENSIGIITVYAREEDIYEPPSDVINTTKPQPIYHEKLFRYNRRHADLLDTRSRGYCN